MFHLCSDQQLTTKQYLFTIGLTFNPSSVNNLELREFASGLSLSTNGYSLNLWASDAGLSPAVQIQENEVMQVALLSSASGSVALQVCAGRMNIPSSLGWAQTLSSRRSTGPTPHSSSTGQTIGQQHVWAMLERGAAWGLKVWLKVGGGVQLQR